MKLLMQRRKIAKVGEPMAYFEPQITGELLLSVTVLLLSVFEHICILGRFEQQIIKPSITIKRNVRHVCVMSRGRGDGPPFNLV